LNLREGGAVHGLRLERCAGPPQAVCHAAGRRVTVVAEGLAGEPPLFAGARWGGHAPASPRWRALSCGLLGGDAPTRADWSCCWCCPMAAKRLIPAEVDQPAR